MRITGGKVAVALSAALLLMAGMLATGLASAQQAAASRADPATRPGLSQKQEDDLAHKHDGYYGALAPQNLHKARPKPPFDMTGTWFVNLRHGFADFMFGPPYPEFLDAGMNLLLAIRQRQVKEYVQRVRVAGFGERFENGRAGPMLESYLRAH